MDSYSVESTFILNIHFQTPETIMQTFVFYEREREELERKVEYYQSTEQDEERLNYVTDVIRFLWSRFVRAVVDLLNASSRANNDGDRYDDTDVQNGFNGGIGNAGDHSSHISSGDIAGQDSPVE